jgi:hypothetical protein
LLLVAVQAVAQILAQAAALVDSAQGHHFPLEHHLQSQLAQAVLVHLQGQQPQRRMALHRLCPQFHQQAVAVVVQLLAQADQADRVAVVVETQQAALVTHLALLPHKVTAVERLLRARIIFLAVAAVQLRQVVQVHIKSVAMVVMELFQALQGPR